MITGDCMKRLRVVGVLTASALAMLAPLGSSASGASEGLPAVAAAKSTRSVSVVRAPRHVEEGKRFRVTLRVDAPSAARRVAVQNLQTDVYGNTEWVTLRSKRVNGVARQRFRLLAEGLNLQKYRAVATYRDKPRAVASPRFAIHIWRWIDLQLYRPYYSTYGVAINGYSEFSMNGDRWLGWYAYGGSGMWESRHTPGRDCKAFRGVFGVTDESQDGSSAEFTVLADETETVFRSKPLGPGGVQKAKFSLARPYRLSVQARSTSPGVPVAPAIGLPQLLCTDL